MAENKDTTKNIQETMVPETGEAKIEAKPESSAKKSKKRKKAKGTIISDDCVELTDAELEEIAKKYMNFS